MPEPIETTIACATSTPEEATRIYFGHATALQILRAAKQAELVSPRRRAQTLPHHAPAARELQHRIERLESSHPDLTFTKPIHVLVGSPNCRASHACKPQVCAKPLSNDSLLRLERQTFVTAPELSLVQMAAQEHDWVSLLKLEWEARGSYQTKRTSSRSAYQVAPLTSVRALRAYVSKHPSTKGAHKIARHLPYLADGSASPRETKLALILGLPIMYGGYGLGIPRMNHKVLASGTARAISGRKGFRCDLCWPEAKLDVEYQSRENHEGETNRVRDSRRTNALVAMGWTVICITNDELDSMFATDAIAQSIRLKLGKRMQMRVSDHHARKLKLRRKLGLPVGFA